MPKLSTPSLDVSTVIAAPPADVFKAFFDPVALRLWWRVQQSVTTPRVLGPFALEWPTADHDEVLGRLGGVFRGTVMQVDASSGFFVADAYWLPPDGHPIGPMALHVDCELEVGDEGQVSTRVRVTQSGFEESARWRRYYEVTELGWTRALDTLRRLLED
jgi:uncharacterized protein YndB with AHSA1/START domain